MKLSFSLDENFNTRPTLTEETLYDVLIIGAGPGGLSAALYAKRKGLNTAILAKRKGGQILDTSTIDNYLGIENISGHDLAERFENHLAKLHVPVLDDVEVVGITPGESEHHINLSTGEAYKAKAIIIATGAKPRQLGIPGEINYIGKGVSYCAICDAPLFANKDILVAGGGNAALEAALDLAKTSNSVKLIHRSVFRADKVLTDKLANDPRITVQLATKIVEVTGKENMNGVITENIITKEKSVVKADGLFIEIGHIPNSDFVRGIVDLDAHGQIITNRKLETNVPGIFAAGDVTDCVYKQISIAVSDGAIAALGANDYINKKK